MKWFMKQNYLSKCILVIIVFFVLFIISRLFFSISNTIPIQMEQEEKNMIVNSEIKESGEQYKIEVNYPKFKKEEINKIVNTLIYKKIEEFKNNVIKLANTINNFNVDYELYFIDEYVNIFFTIDNSLNKKDKYESVLINLNTSSQSLITDIYSEDVLNNNISLFFKKYPAEVSKIIKTKSYEDFEYLIKDEGFKMILNNFEDVEYANYIPNIDNNAYYYQVDNTKKMIALTFDDGPSDYTKEIMECLILNHAKATFFQTGNNMNKRKEITKSLYDAGMEIGNHSYYHDKLGELPIEKVFKQIEDTENLFEEITGDKMKLLRPPYGNMNNKMLDTLKYPIITWNIDTLDWKYLNEFNSASKIIGKMYDGDIVLMHDIHAPTAELVRMLVPLLKQDGFELVTVSELAKYKNKELKNGEIIENIK